MEKNKNFAKCAIYGRVGFLSQALTDEPAVVVCYRTAHQEGKSATEYHAINEYLRGHGIRKVILMERTENYDVSMLNIDALRPGDTLIIGNFLETRINTKQILELSKTLIEKEINLTVLSHLREISDGSGETLAEFVPYSVVVPSGM